LYELVDNEVLYVAYPIAIYTPPKGGSIACCIPSVRPSMTHAYF